MLTLHHLENSRSQRILWLLEELAVDYTVKRYARDSKTGLAPASLLDVHPLGKSPVITDGTVTVAESGAIIEYLVSKYDDGRLLPPEGTQARMAYVYWLHYAEGTMMPLLIVSLILSRMESAPMPFFARPIARGIAEKVRDAYLDPNLKRNLGFVEMTLNESAWLCGEELSAADIQMSFALEAAEVRTPLRESYPNIARFLQRARERDAYGAALKKGGPYSLRPA